MIWRRYMERAPGIRMTRLAGAASRKVIAGCIRYQAAVTRMT